MRELTLGMAISNVKRVPPRKLTHVDTHGRVRMVDVSAKPVTTRDAVARGRVFMHRDTLERLKQGDTPKADVLATARIAGIQAAKRTPELIPLAHAIPVEGVEIEFSHDETSASVGIEVRVRSRGRTGVEMEALTAVSVAALTLYDMLKAVDRGMVIGEIALWEKRGGRSGDYRRRP
jgi:cyclic pyranopterin monophosphate synthase